MPKLVHRFLCNVSSRYRVTHCQHIDELPKRIQRRIFAECEEMDPRSWNSSEEMMRDLLAEIDAEEAAEKESSFRKVAVFA